jgi:hypothetical protein
MLVMLSTFNVWQVTSKKAAIINHYSEMKEKLGSEASISIGTSLIYYLCTATIL